MKTAPGIALIISTYERPAALEKVLEGVLAQSRKPQEILIADDGSGAATRELLQRWQARLDFRHVWHEHAGFRKAIILNQTIAATASDYVVLLDGDCVPHRHFIRDHERLAEEGFWVQGRRCFVEEAFVPAFSVGHTPVWLWCLQGRVTGLAKALRPPFPVINRNRRQRGIIGCNLGIWRADLLAVNGFDEGYSGWGQEDSDLGSRLYHLGRTRKFVYGRALVYHLNHPPLSRAQVPANQQRLAQTIAAGKIRSEVGLDRHLPT